MTEQEKSVDRTKLKIENFDSSSDNLVDFPNPSEYFLQIGSFIKTNRKSDLRTGKSRVHFSNSGLKIKSSSFLNVNFPGDSYLKIPKQSGIKYSSYNGGTIETNKKSRNKKTNFLMPNQNSRTGNYEKSRTASYQKIKKIPTNQSIQAMFSGGKTSFQRQNQFRQRFKTKTHFPGFNKVTPNKGTMGKNITSFRTNQLTEHFKTNKISNLKNFQSKNLFEEKKYGNNLLKNTNFKMKTNYTLNRCRKNPFLIQNKNTKIRNKSINSNKGNQYLSKKILNSVSNNVY